MNLTELKKKSAADLITIAQELKLEGTARSRKQDVIFAIL
ncbi:MAG: Rho termination factor N-terminal domain-containing protein, partial [Candidatus Competibacteraceae bacterium]|nr:Rho termination factor N-terminal domain-containing protein [Candidatus Competibacteraceae bacterium]